LHSPQRKIKKLNFVGINDPKKIKYLCYEFIGIKSRER
jgi:hypothetical protein